MNRVALLAAAAIAGFAGSASGQLVPLARCQAALPCSIPYGLRPADAVANLPDAGLGNTLVGVAVDGALKPRIAAPAMSSDPVEAAARIYVKKNPLPERASTPAPTPVPRSGSAPKDLQLP
jgi:hypothetical protein